MHILIVPATTEQQKEAEIDEFTYRVNLQGPAVPIIFSNVSSQYIMSVIIIASLVIARQCLSSLCMHA